MQDIQVHSPPTTATEKFLSFSEKITTANTLDELYAISAQEICSNLNCDFSFIYLLTNEDTFELKVPEKTSNFPLQKVYQRTESWLGAWWGRNRKIESPTKIEVPYKNSTQKIIAFPINNEIRTFGVIGAICGQEHINEFSYGDINRLKTYAKIISLAATSKKQTKKLNFVLETFQLVRRESDEKQMFQQIANQLAKDYSKFNACLIHLYDDVQKNLYGYVSSGIREVRGSSRIEVGENVIGVAYETGKEVAHTNNKDFVYKKWAKDNGFKSMISIRLDDVNKEPYGVLSVFTKYPYEEDKEDEAFLENFINQASTLISSIIHEKSIKKLTDIEAIIGSIIPFEKSLEDILQTFLQKSLESLQGEIGFISLYPKDSEIITANCCETIGEEFQRIEIPEKLSLIDKESLASWVFMNRKSYLYTSNSQIDNISKPYRNLNGRTVKSEILVPLIYQKEFIGIIVLSSTKKHAFDYKDLDFLESIAQKAAQVIQSKRFRDASLTLNEFKYDELDEKTIYEETAIITNEILGTPICCIWKLEKSNDGIEILNLWSSEGLDMKSYDADALEMEKGKGGISWKVIDEVGNNPNDFVCKVFRNIQSPQSGFKHTNFANENNLKSMISVPIVLNGEVYGVINAYTKTDYKFFEHEKILLGNVAVRCAAALFNAQLKHQHEDLLEKWTNINTIANPGIVALTFVHDIGHYIHYLNSDISMLRGFMKQKSRNTKAINSVLNSASTNSRSIRKSSESLVRIGKRVRDKKKPYSLKKIIEPVKTLFQRRFERSKIKFNYSFGGEEDIVFTCYPTEIEQLFVNLTLNAVTALKAKPQGIKEIHIKAAHFADSNNKKWVKIEYSDNGVGITEKDQHKVFNIDFSTKGEEGSGFGLSICKRIVTENHEGKIDLHSVFGKETTFFIYLPN